MAKKQKSRSTGAQRIADMFGETLTDEQRATNAATSPTTETTTPATSAENQTPPDPTTVPPQGEDRREQIDLTKLPRERINTTISPQTAQAFAILQAHAKSQGWKKPKIGEIIDEGVAMVLDKYGL